MKNYFTSVVIPGETPTCAQLAHVIRELISQLGYTVNNLELDNMTPDTQSRVTEGRIHIKTQQQINDNKLSDVKKGDLVLVAGEQNGILTKVSSLYVCSRNGGE